MAEPAHNPPLNYEASDTMTHPQVSSSLPPEVVTCLKNARFVSKHHVRLTPQFLLTMPL